MPATIGITVDNRDNTAASGTYESASAYSLAVSEAGGIPLLLPHDVRAVDTYLDLCDGLILTGGVDPDTTKFGQPLHARARVMDPIRQQFETLLLERSQASNCAVLGVCLGMQLMALHAGGTLNQYMPETMAAQNAQRHTDNQRHPIRLLAKDSALGETVGYENVVSSHQQCVSDAGRLRVVATTMDDVIEAIDDPARRFYLGVQWHPERGEQGPLNRGLIQRFVDATRDQS